ncbi:hypothetical protein C5C07_13680 [Haloferax sp. Atlit-4N]|uniref:DUF8159 domain-containing protein n=1 Tax=Haloferax gibbonsii (strain ATCC 33959 / DSM 4427 / JCM 8863 / NBRC 102184 / NCIMB 2188 / Ma 2.38) TaxID=1227459 RepID=M0HAA4_HALGM|nr:MULTISPECIES: hypothetical protein [Haloferax]ELZ80039.1 hypothetical protein C454_12583 [Haloferax gibbonsii ATCC 33959]RDZ52806.1 hypothetical protein C5C07_13680 [Haloferax sp. Atlit-4N]
MPSRRLVLGSFASLFAGCSASPSPPTTPDSPTTRAEPESPTATSSPDPYESHLASFGRFLDSESVALAELTADERASVVSLTYESDARSTDRLSNEIGTVAGGFFREVAAGWTASRLEATIVAAAADSGAVVARWRAESTWFDAYDRGDISADELSLRVLQTLERA